MSEGILYLGRRDVLSVLARIDPAPMKTVAALLNDSNPIHWDVESVKSLGMGDRVVNQGPNNMAYVAKDQETIGPRLVKEYNIQKLTTCSTCHY